MKRLIVYFAILPFIGNGQSLSKEKQSFDSLFLKLVEIQTLDNLSERENDDSYEK